ncbi:hypothetical protein BC829DRAFT_475399 [Chytridium lagenaria]|nr:hypothetical protein BC829DRAFT_475399 [Chytridium lagenaria]
MSSDKSFKNIGIVPLNNPSDWPAFINGVKNWVARQTSSFKGVFTTAYYDENHRKYDKRMRNSAKVVQAILSNVSGDILKIINEAPPEVSKTARKLLLFLKKTYGMNNTSAVGELREKLRDIKYEAKDTPVSFISRARSLWDTLSKANQAEQATEIAGTKTVSHTQTGYKGTMQALLTTVNELKEQLSELKNSSSVRKTQVNHVQSRNETFPLQVSYPPDLDDGVSQWAFDTGLTDQALTPFLEDLQDPTPYRAGVDGAFAGEQSEMLGIVKGFTNLGHPIQFPALTRAPTNIWSNHHIVDSNDFSSFHADGQFDLANQTVMERELEKLHTSLGHPSRQVMKRMLRKKQAYGIGSKALVRYLDALDPCTVCSSTRQRKTSKNDSTRAQLRRLQRIHVDLGFGPSQAPHKGSTTVAVIVDSSTSFVWVSLLPTKSQLADRVITLIETLRREFHHTPEDPIVTELRADQAKE